MRSPSQAVRLLLAAFVALVGSAAAAAVESLRLDNGVEAVIVPRRGSDAVLFSVAIDAGSQDEPATLAGMSHFLEHLLFDGYDELDERGVTERFAHHAAYVNATTRSQSTIFFALAPAEEAPAVAQIIAGMLARSTIPPAAFEKEKKVILEELARDAAMPEMVSEQQAQLALWSGTLAARPTGGDPQTVQAARRDDVLRYWKERYRPDAMRVLIAGDLPPTELKALLAPLATLPAATGKRQPRGSVLRWPGWGQWRREPAPAQQEGSRLLAALALPPDVDPEVAATLAACFSEPGSTPATALEEFDLSIDHATASPEDIWTIELRDTKGGALEAVLPRLLSALAQAATRGPDRETWQRVATARQAQRHLDEQRLHYMAVLRGDLLATARGDLAHAFSERLPRYEEGLAAARRILESASARLRVVLLEPGAKASPWSALPPAPPASGSMTTNDPRFDTTAQRTRSTLPNGLTLLAREESGASVFAIHLLVADRSAREPAELPGVAELAHRLLAQGSLQSDSATLARRLSRLGVTLKTADDVRVPFDDYQNDKAYSYVRMEGPADRLPEALPLLAELLQAPRLEPMAYAAAVDDWHAARRAAKGPGTLAGLALRRRLLGDNAWTHGPIPGPDGGPEISLDALAAFIGRWPAGYFAPSRLVLSIVSDRPPGEIRARVDELLGDGPSNPPQREARPQPLATPSAAQPQSDPPGPQISVSWGRVANVPPETAPALALALAALSDRMVAQIREKAGLAYRLGAGASSLGGDRWLLEASVGTRPENRAAVTAAFLQIVDELATTPLSPSDLQRLTADRRRQEMLDGLAAISRAARLSLQEFDGNAAPHAVTAAQMAQVTAPQLQAAAKQYLAKAGWVSAY